ncbi:hypothetical protein L902_10595 [Agrobacterium radiobacter DSM 30147]|nr:hypothetical protein L902_10595 [Agrobacterium radiobacter DSM 30147]
MTHPDRAPEAVAISVMAAGRIEYAVSLSLEIVAASASAAIIKAEAEKRIIAAATSRILIGGEIPEALLSGAAFGDGVIRVRDLAPVVIEPDPYKVPVMASLDVQIEVRA